MASDPRAGRLGPTDRPSVQLGALIAAAALGYAIELANGYWVPEALLPLLLAALAPVLGLLLPAADAWQRPCARALPPMLAAAAVLQMSMLTAFRPAHYLKLTSVMQSWAMHALAAGVLVLGMGGDALGLGRRVRAAGLALATLGLGLWTLSHSPEPHTDVFVFARDGARALLHLQNPFAITFPDIYGDAGHYHPALLRAGRVLHGFCYPPLNLLVALGEAIWGDPRATMATALAIAAWLLARLGPAAAALPAAALLVLTPRCIFLIEQSFMEPLAILMLVGTAVSARRRPALTPWLLGLLLVSKQTMPFLALSALLLPQLQRRQEMARFAARTLAAGCAVTVPSILWSPRAFYHSVIEAQLLQIKAPTSLTLAAWLRETHRAAHVPMACSFVLLAACTALLLWRAPRTPAGFCLGFGLSHLALLLLGAQGFANYHHLTIAAMWAAVALAEPSLEAA